MVCQKVLKPDCKAIDIHIPYSLVIKKSHKVQATFPSVEANNFFWWHICCVVQQKVSLSSVGTGIGT